MLIEEPFIEFVCNEAVNIGKLFILDSGEGNDCIDKETGWYIEDLSGWLINPNEEQTLIYSRFCNTAYDEFSNNYVYAKWSKTDDGKLKIVFKKYN